MIRNNVIDTVLSYGNDITNQLASVTKYKYNFPERRTGILFWRKLALLLVKKIIHDALEDQFDIKLKKLNIAYPVTSNKTLNQLNKVNAYLNYCNDKNWIQVNEVVEPIFVTPHVVFNPNEINKAKAYILLGYEDDAIQLHKLSQFDTQVWRQYVWNVLKEKRSAINIKYADSIEVSNENVDLNNL